MDSGEDSYIGIRSGNPTPFFSLAIFLNEDYVDGYGGELVLYKGQDEPVTIPSTYGKFLLWKSDRLKIAMEAINKVKL